MKIFKLNVLKWKLVKLSGCKLYFTLKILSVAFLIHLVRRFSCYKSAYMKGLDYLGWFCYSCYRWSSISYMQLYIILVTTKKGKQKKGKKKRKEKIDTWVWFY